MSWLFICVPLDTKCIVRVHTCMRLHCISFMPLISYPSIQHHLRNTSILDVHELMNLTIATDLIRSDKSITFTYP